MIGNTGLIFVRNRYYDPELGRFITADPVGYVDGPNVYGFAKNDPVNGRDPLGLLEGLKKAEASLPETSDLAILSLDKKSSSWDIIRVGLGAGFLEAGADAIGLLNLAANLLVKAALPSNTKLPKEASREIGDAAKAGVDCLVKDPECVARKLDVRPAIRTGLAAAGGDKQAQAKIVREGTRLGTEAAAGELARGAALGDELAGASREVAYDSKLFGSRTETRGSQALQRFYPENNGFLGETRRDPDERPAN